MFFKKIAFKKMELYIFMLVFCIVLLACKKSQAKVLKSNQMLQNIENQSFKKNDKMNEDLKKLSLVLKNLRFDLQISFEDADEFLQDLKIVLQSEEEDLFRLVDKNHPLPEGYVPKNLVALEKNDHYNINRADLSLKKNAQNALVELAEGAKSCGIKLLVSSTYRSFEYQSALFNRYVLQDGYEQAVRYSAPPGTSQHQMGVAIDFGSIDDSFAQTKEGKWLSENAWKFGWSLSFPREMENVTGFVWECWHYRFLGKSACAFQKKWFNDIQQYMLEFFDAWKHAE